MPFKTAEEKVKFTEKANFAILEIPRMINLRGVYASPERIIRQLITTHIAFLERAKQEKIDLDSSLLEKAISDEIKFIEEILNTSNTPETIAAAQELFYMLQSYSNMSTAELQSLRVKLKIPDTTPLHNPFDFEQAKIKEYKARFREEKLFAKFVLSGDTHMNLSTYLKKCSSYLATDDNIINSLPEEFNALMTSMLDSIEQIVASRPPNNNDKEAIMELLESFQDKSLLDKKKSIIAALEKPKESATPISQHLNAAPSIKPPSPELISRAAATRIDSADRSANLSNGQFS